MYLLDLVLLYHRYEDALISLARGILHKIQLRHNQVGYMFMAKVT